MVNMIVDQTERLNHYWSCLKAFLIIVGCTMLLTGCNMGVGGAVFTFKNFDDKNYRPLIQAIGAVGFLMGLWFIYLGFYKLKVYGQMRTMMAAQYSIVPPLMLLLVGTLLFYFPYLVRTSLATIWGSGDILTYMGNGAGAAWTSYFRPIVHVMELIGYVAFIKGWVLLSRLGREGGQSNQAGKGFMHILGGLLCINFLGTIEIIRNSFA